jgi:hypothetical protein
VAEWLRSGLQSRLHRFDSGRRLSRRSVVRVLPGRDTDPNEVKEWMQPWLDKVEAR